MKHWTIQQRVTWGFALVILISAGICAFAVMRMTAIQREAVAIQQDAVPSLHFGSELAGLASYDYAWMLERMYTTNRGTRAELEVVLEGFGKDFDSKLAKLQPSMATMMAPSTIQRGNVSIFGKTIHGTRRRTTATKESVSAATRGSTSVA